MDGYKGTLVVDMYTGYNRVVGVGGRERAGCLAHVRRKFFDNLNNHSEAAEALELITKIYRVEHRARELGIAATAEHGRMREQESLPHMDKLYLWLAEKEPLYSPGSEMRKAIRYAMKNWQAMTRFIHDPRLPPGNNRSEAALRVVALGRKNFSSSAMRMRARTSPASTPSSPLARRPA